MTARVLIVEDDADFIDELLQVFSDLQDRTEIQIANSRDGAIKAIEQHFFDLVVLDLKIPTIDGALDADPSHGHSVFARARSVVPGTPTLILTGSPAEDFIPALLAGQQQVDIWSEGRAVGSVDFLKKYKFDECPSKLAPVIAAIRRLTTVELNRRDVNLSLPEERLIRIFALKFGGALCAVSRLGGGLSSAKVLRLRVQNEAGALIHDAVAKLGTPDDIRDEAGRFDTYVSRLDPRATPRKLATLEFGAGALCGVFYGLAEGFDLSAFDVALNNDGSAAAAVRGIASATSRWTTEVPQSRRPIREIRRRVLSDAELIKIRGSYPLPWADGFENNEIQIRWACVHGDLHGSNALIDRNGAAVIIDYGDVGEGPAGLDPVTLELSVIFHPQRIALGEWPSLEQARQWGDLEVYLKDCPAREFVGACRAWAHNVCAGQREVAAAAYSYLVRQLKYADTDKALALALIEGMKAYYEAT